MKIIWKTVKEGHDEDDEECHEKDGEEGHEGDD